MLFLFFMPSPKVVRPDSAASLQALTLSASTGLPILFVQLGSYVNLFFDRVLQQAAHSNGHGNVFVLTDNPRADFAAYHTIDIAGYAGEGNVFDTVYRHHSTNPVTFEKACFDRWFIINELVSKLHIPYFLHADCDVMIYQDLKPVYELYLKDRYDGSIMYFEHGDNSVTSGHTSFWSAKMISDFCRFAIGRYQDAKAFEQLLKMTLAGKFLDNKNVSDMILLDVFRTETRPNALNLLSLEDAGVYFDFNVNVSFNGWHNHYAITRGSHVKKVAREADGFYVQVTGTPQKLIKAYSLHFQGYKTKTIIPLRTTAAQGIQAMRNVVAGNVAYLLRAGRLVKNRIKGSIKK